MACSFDSIDGHFLMGSSNLTGRYWGGSIWYYDDPSLAPSVEKCLTAYEINSGVVDAAFIDEKNIVVGQVSILNPINSLFLIYLASVIEYMIFTSEILISF